VTRTWLVEPPESKYSSGPDVPFAVFVDRSFMYSKPNFRSCVPCELGRK